MVSKRPGAYKFAHKKNGLAEDKYFKALFLIDKLENRLKCLQGSASKIQAFVTDVAAEYTNHQTNKNSEAVTEKLKSLQLSLKQMIDSNKNIDILMGFSANTQTSIRELINEVDKQKIVTMARKLTVILPTESITVNSQLSTSRKDADDALCHMEKWAKRELETDDYSSVMREEEQEWFARELQDNTDALMTMRSYIPSNISDLSINDLLEAAKSQGGLLSMELATELKNNKLLHWVVTHIEDITSANFLTGDKKSYFENLESLDVIELRALSLCIPVKFELDNDGKKSEWRNRFMNRVKQIVSQNKREMVKGPWDEKEGKRLMIQLPELTSSLARRPIYFFRTKEQSDLRLKSYDDKSNLLEKKKIFFEKAEVEASDAKREYDTILQEMRDPDFKDQYGIEQVFNIINCIINYSIVNSC